MDVPASNFGILYVAALPIGNTRDITDRVKKTAVEADYVLAEDTRSANRLFAKYQLKPTLISYHEHSSQSKREKIIDDLKSGLNIMLTCEAGTPTISDPGYQLIRTARQEGIIVLPLPGASAVIAALSVSGFATDHFFFAGFLAKKQKKSDQLRELLTRTETVVVYESPHRLVDSLEQIAGIDPEREVFVAREMTKMHEQYLIGNAADLLKSFDTDQNIKGEVVLIIKGNKELIDNSTIKKLVSSLLAKNISDRDIVDITTAAFSIKRNAVRQIISECVKM